MGRDILNWCAEDNVFTATGAIAEGKSMPTQVLPYRYASLGFLCPLYPTCKADIEFQ